MLDIPLLLERTNLPALLERDLGAPVKHSGGWLWWHCPFHVGDNTPSFGCRKDDTRFYCFGCGKGGDALSWLTEYRRVSFKAALQELGAPVHPQNMRVQEKIPEREQGPVSARDAYAPPAVEWQAAMRDLAAEAERALWSDDGVKALAWLHKRGLKDETIKRFHLGFNPVERHKPFVDRGITIPCFVGGNLWYVKIRRPAGDPKYRCVGGSRPVALFNADDLQGVDRALLCEGEFDCMTAWQELNDVIACATFGAASNRPDLATWGLYLLPLRQVFVCFDNDANETGWAAALDVCQLLGDAAKLAPPPEGYKDLNDLYTSGGDLWAWLKHYLNFYSLPDFGTEV